MMKLFNIFDLDNNEAHLKGGNMYKKIKVGQFGTEHLDNLNFILNESKYYKNISVEAKSIFLYMFEFLVSQSDLTYVEKGNNQYILLEEFSKYYLEEQDKTFVKDESFDDETILNCIKELEENKLITLEPSNNTINKSILIYLSDIDSYHSDLVLKSTIKKLQNYIYNAKNHL